MNIIDREKALQKIKRCLALSKSANEHEAAIAMNQARALMEKFQIDDNDMLALEIKESQTRSGATSRPSRWETWLANIVGGAFNCKVILLRTRNNQCIVEGYWKFIGVDPSPEIASYAFVVLIRQVRVARKNYTETILKRVKSRENKTRRADLFCEGWIEAAQKVLGNASIPAETKTRIDAYLTKKGMELSPLKPTDRSEGKKLRDYDYNDMDAGRQEGKNAQYHIGMTGADPIAGLGMG